MGEHIRHILLAAGLASAIVTPVVAQESAQEPAAGQTRHETRIKKDRWWEESGESSGQAPGQASGEAAAQPAQEPPEPLPTIPLATGETPPLASDAVQLDDVMVTSQKRVQSIQDVPISVTALTGQMLYEQAVTDVREALQLTPNARIDSAGFFAAPRVRGFTLNNNNKSFEPPVGMVLDGIPHSRTEYFNAALMDVERLEVMRGPQGTTFGKNTTAGLVSLISARPSSAPTGVLTLEGGELDRRRIEGAYGGPLGDSLNVRVAGLLDERAGFVENTTARVLASAPRELKDRRRTGVRAAVEMPDLWGTTLLVAHEEYALYDGGAALEMISSGPVLRDVIRTNYDRYADFTPGNWVQSQDYADFRDVSLRRTRFEATRAFGEWELVALGAHSVLDQTLALDTDFTPAPAILGSGNDYSPESYGEVRIASPTLAGLLGLSFMPGESDFLVGVSGGRRQILNSHFKFGINNRPFWDLVAAAGADANSDAPPGGIVGGVPFDPLVTPDKFDEMDQLFEQTADELSGFAHMKWTFLPAWGLGMELGGRYTTEKKQGFWDMEFTTPSPNPTLQAVGAEEFTATRQLDLENFQPKVSLNWQPQRDLGVFLHWEKGFKAGGFNAFAFREGTDPTTNAGFEDDDLQFRDEVATNIGLDVKTWLFGRTMNLNVSLFREEVKDFQVLIRENPPGTIGLGTSRVINAEEAYAEGVEADLRWLPLSWLNITGSLGVLKTEFVSFKDGECPVGHTDPADDGDPDNPRCNQSGKSFPFAPELSGALSVRVNTPMERWPLVGPAFSGLSFVAGAVAEYEDTQLLDIDLDERKRQPAYTRYKADIGLSSMANRWTVRLVGENLTNTVTWVRMGDILTDVIHGSQNQPRLMYLQFRQEF
jgi:iron complex outermembrane recepter protein